MGMQAHGTLLCLRSPLFPNGYYVTLAGYTGFVNFIHVKSSITLHPTKSLKLMFAVYLGVQYAYGW
jgi:hypothetical protein